MPKIAIFGAQWGDEGKGKLVDLLSGRADLVVRFQGGNNAGHTVVVEGNTVILHLIPSGVLHPQTRCAIGNGVVLDPQVFCQEIDTLAEQGIRLGPDRLTVSPKTHIITPYHKLIDAAREQAKSAGNKIGTTGRGIGPCYEDKTARTGIRAGDLARPDLLKSKLAQALKEKNVLLEHLYGQKPLDVDEVFGQMLEAGKRLIPYLGDVSALIQQSAAADRTILFEGAQGIQLDIDHGTYPFVTSSNTVVGAFSAGSGCPANFLDRIVAVAKAYTTRVGAGPFPTELDDATGERLQQQGLEFGATTGRKRRCGWLDLAVLKEMVRLNGPTEIALTKLDVLSGFPEIKVCVAYEYKGGRIDCPPQEENGLSEVKPVYETLPGWNVPLTGIETWDDLPGAAREYIEYMEAFLGVPVSMISVGPGREQTFERPLAR